MSHCTRGRPRVGHRLSNAAISIIDTFGSVATTGHISVGLGDSLTAAGRFSDS